MARAPVKEVVQTALDLIKQSDSTPIIYVNGGEDPRRGLDCQGYIEYCVRQNGGQMIYAGSNEMWRFDGDWYGTLPQAKKEGKLVPGALLFIVDNDGGEPPQYKVGGKKYVAGFDGNASHVGYYLGISGYEVGHASGSRGRVAASTLKNGWTHVLLSKNIEYGDLRVPATVEDKEETAVNFTAYTVVLPESNRGETVNLRKSPSSAATVLVRVRDGSSILCSDEKILSSGIEWKKTVFNGVTGYVHAQYVREGLVVDVPAPATPFGVEERLLSLEQRVQALEDQYGLRG